jgi:hypothetical protein
MIIVRRKSNGIISRLICWFTGEEWSHVGYLSEGKVYHADFLGSRIVSKANFIKGCRWEMRMYRTTHVQNADMTARALKYLKKFYDIPLIFYFIAYYSLLKLGIKTKRQEINPRWRVCSEYTHKVVYDADESLTPGEFIAKIDRDYTLISKTQGGKL